MTTHPLSPAVLKLARTSLGLSQKALAERIGVGKSVVNAWERGQTRPRPHRQAALQRVLHLDSPGAAPVTPDHATEEAARATLLPPTDERRAPLTAAQAAPGETLHVRWQARVVCHTCSAEAPITWHRLTRPTALPPIVCGRCRSRLVTVEDLVRTVSVTLDKAVVRRRLGRPACGRERTAA